MEIIKQIADIRERIPKFHTYSYLYEGFDALVKSLDDQSGSLLNSTEIVELKDLIEVLARESVYNNFASANWMLYSARCFYCADYLVKYLNEPRDRRNMENFLNLYFKDLVSSGVAPIIPAGTLDKYIKMNISPANAKELYGTLILKACNECGKCRLWECRDAELACRYTQSIKQIMKDYVSRYSDLTVQKEWLPALNTMRLAKVWNEYPGSHNYNHEYINSRNVIMKCLDQMLDIHLELMESWYRRNPQEVIEALPDYVLIAILDVIEDHDRERIFRQVSSLPDNEKIQKVLYHYARGERC